VQVDIRPNIAQWRAAFDATQRAVEIAAMVAMTRTAVRVKDAQVQEISKVFNQPVAYTLNSVYVRPATKSRMSAKVWLKDDVSKGTPAEKYLGPHIEGGKRGFKRMEKALRAANVLPAGMYVMPGSAAKMDSNGNMNRGQIVQLLSYLRANRQQDANMNDKRRAAYGRRRAKQYQAQGVQFFVGRPGGGKLPLGVWERITFSKGSAIKPVLIFTSAPAYNKRWRFFEIAADVVDTWLKAEFERALEERGATRRA
jgi:hypothetical protein